ncbi:182 kDa tankyrase-1-binding protein isoform X1 [Pristis pectinata]|uniref:182 kDa tankyrase-1-binding protein isoform X1 n=2 Tax=Pristis pectinata TaxID=685728 RepID=UPI00223CF81D|nr:182 kDa tankyrase-1-binding protein isoform X1 [Pristis pectinata]
MLPEKKEAMATPCRRGPCCREVLGPTPCSVAVIEKHTGTRTQSKMMREADLDSVCQEYRKFVKDFEECKLKNVLELEEEHKRLLCSVRHKLKKAMEFYKDDIEERRERLRELLEAEEKDYVNQLNLLGETVLERQAKMRQQVKDLKIQRERDRQKLIAEKLDQQFREQCEELQTKLSHQREQELVKDWQAQIEFNKRLQNQQKEEDQLFDQLWEKDRLAKEERAEKEMREQNEKKQEILAGQQEQIAEADAKRMDQKRQKEQEAELMKEKQRLSKLEDERLEREKIQKQKKVRDILDNSRVLKAKRMAKEQEEEQALDIKLRDQALKDIADDAQAQMRKKMDLKREQQLYRSYLAQKADDEKLQEEEANRLIEADMEKTWAKRLEQMRLKKEAQDRLKKEVMETRKLQVQEKLEGNTKSPQQLAAERAKLDTFVEEQKQVEEEKLVREKQARKVFQQDLLSQINYQKQQREREKVERQREVEAGKLQEEAYQKKLQEALSKPYTGTEKIHPWRRKNCTVPNEVC